MELQFTVDEIRTQAKKRSFTKFGTETAECCVRGFNHELNENPIPPTIHSVHGRRMEEPEGE